MYIYRLNNNKYTSHVLGIWWAPSAGRSGHCVLEWACLNIWTCQLLYENVCMHASSETKPTVFVTLACERSACVWLHEHTMAGQYSKLAVHRSIKKHRYAGNTN